jgi:hypothetical protein
MNLSIKVASPPEIHQDESESESIDNDDSSHMDSSTSVAQDQLNKA